MSGTLDLIGNTSFVRLSRAKESSHEISFKLEHNNPTGSIKDKNALYFITKARELGLLKPGGEIIESSSGNLGISLTVIGKQLGHKSKIIIDHKTSETMKRLLELYGAEIHVIDESFCDEVGSMQKARMEYAKRLHLETPNSWYVCQHLNPMSADVHYYTTAPEIEKYYKGSPDIIVVGVSTAGQLAGISRYFKERYQKTQIWGVDVAGSGIFTTNRHPYKMTGLGLSFIPAAFDWSLVDRTFTVDDELSFSFCYELTKEYGLFLGASSGAILAATLRGLQDEGSSKKVCMISADNGHRYLDTFYDDEWLKTHSINIMTGDELRKGLIRVNEYSKTTNNNEINL